MKTTLTAELSEEDIRAAVGLWLKELHGLDVTEVRFFGTENASPDGWCIYAEANCNPPELK